MKFVVCNKKYTGKSETTFNLRLNTPRKDVNKQSSLQADQHYLSRSYFRPSLDMTIAHFFGALGKQNAFFHVPKKATYISNV